MRRLTKLIVLAVVILASVGVYTMVHVHNANCKWIAPLKTNYVMCSDGVVRQK